jgi:hypothetical protein
MEITKTSAEIVNGKVIRVIVGDTEWAISRLGGNWVDTTELQVGAGYTYDEENGFRPEQPYPSWTWSIDGWQPPTPYPTDNKFYIWNEELKLWVKVQ